ncbi:MAG: hypothetical protein U0892_22985 [Pirellulales bacterium]
MNKTVEGSLARTTPRRRDSDLRPAMDEATDRVVIAGRIPLATANETVLEAKQLTKIYRKGRHEVPVLKGCDFQAARGKVTVPSRTERSKEHAFASAALITSMAEVSTSTESVLITCLAAVAIFFAIASWG